MTTLNRLGNCKNPFQGKRKRVLCLCSAGLLRSPTIAWVLSNEPFNFNTRAAGVNTEYALIPVDTVLLEWADLVVGAEQWHIDAAKRISDAKPMLALEIEDRFAAYDPKLIALIKKKIEDNIESFN